MKISYKLFGGLGAAALLIGAFAIMNSATAQDKKQAASTKTITDAFADWPDASRKAIDEMKKKYGEPNETTANMVIWNNKSPWKKIIVYKNEVDHNFPMPHKDVLEQVINYEVPLDKYDDMAMFDGSVVLKRTEGEMSARCDKEPMNILALNLANDVAKGNKDVKAARDAYANTVVAFMKKQNPPVTQKLQFSPMEKEAGDEDNVSDNIELKEMMKMMGKKIEERATDGY